MILADLWIGRWVCLDAITLGVPAAVRIPLLVVILFFGPLGLALYLSYRFLVKREFSLFDGKSVNHFTGRKKKAMEPRSYSPSVYGSCHYLTTNTVNFYRNSCYIRISLLIKEFKNRDRVPRLISCVIEKITELNFQPAIFIRKQCGVV